VLPPEQATRLLLTLIDRNPTTVTSSPTVSDPDQVTRVIQLCGYLPLAIALAAGRLRSHPTWSLAYLADLLDHAPQRLEQLAVGDRSIQAAFTVSYQHLTPQRQRIFALLGVHPGPSIDTYALAALADCSLTQAHHHLEALHADHLIQETTPGRYQLHDLLRIYASSLAATADHADTKAAMRRVLDYYLYTATTTATHMLARPDTPHHPAHTRGWTPRSGHGPGWTPNWPPWPPAWNMPPHIPIWSSRWPPHCTTTCAPAAPTNRPCASTTPRWPPPNAPTTGSGKPSRAPTSAACTTCRAIGARPNRCSSTPTSSTPTWMTGSGKPTPSSLWAAAC
jgi:hypothetical protein